MSRTPSQRNEVIRRLEEAERKGTARPGELLLLARLHDDDGQWPAAKALLLRLAADHGEELQYLRAAAGALLLHGEPAPAKEFVERLSVKEPRALPTIELRARLLDATGHPQEAAGLLRTYLTQNPSRLKEIARLADQMSPGGSELAESLYKKFAAAHRDDDADALILAEYYVRTNQPEKAIEHCVADNPPASPERISQACIQALDLCRPAPSPAILNRVDGWLSRALAKSPGAYELQLHLALLRTLQGREEDAVAIYRKVLSSHPDDLFTLNNLSWMLALKFSRGEEALALIDRAIAGSSPSPSLLDTRAVALIALGRGGEAVQELKKALRLDADPATRQSLYFHMAQALLIENDQPAAQGAFRDALQAGLSAESLPALERPQFHQLHGELMSN